ncbi:glycogen synthase GlgA [candidate division KSB1 bacterium]|nr:glycogen synthase GlgA [candidate division KSB1 bacterium]
MSNRKRSEFPRVLFVTSEVTPFSKTGGLADISGALPKALSRLGCDVRVLSPLYGCVDGERHALAVSANGAQPSLTINGRALHAEFARAPRRDSEPDFCFLRCDALYDRPGIYVDPFSNQDYVDNDYRFIALAKCAFDLCRSDHWTPDVLQCNDWQAGLVPLYLSQRRRRGEFAESRAVMTVHNMAYHGWFKADTVARIGDAEALYFPGGPIEFYGMVNFLKAGLEFADGLSTVSPTYAHEIQSSYDFGFGLETVLRGSPRPLQGILNGIDTEVWNPETDPRIAANFGIGTLPWKVENKRALCAKAGFEFNAGVPVFAVISRIVGQKGFEILAPLITEILSLPAQFVILGSGDPYYEHMFHELARVYPDRFAVKLAYDEDLAHLIEAGSDMFLMPSKFEPCGLNQMMSMRYGTIPIVRVTGGLADTVIDADTDLLHGTGFRFYDYTSGELMHAVERAVSAYQDADRWRRIQRNAMSQDFSWDRSARQYLQLYQECLSQPPRVA